MQQDYLEENAHPSCDDYFASSGNLGHTMRNYAALREQVDNNLTALNFKDGEEYFADQQPVAQDPTPMQYEPKFVMDVFSEIFINDEEKDTLFRGLSSLAVCPDDSYRIAFGTNIQDPHLRDKNRLVVMSLDPENGAVRQHNNADASRSYFLSDHLRAVDWIDNRRLAFATALECGVYTFEDDSCSCNVVSTDVFPPFLNDIIRDLSVCTELGQPLLLTGGIGGCLYVTEIDRIMGDITARRQESVRFSYSCGPDAVGSVSWHDFAPSVAACTTDGGTFHMLDIRSENPPLVFSTNKLSLFSHAFRGEYGVFLGYGDGTIRMYDTRNPTQAQAEFEVYGLNALGSLHTHNPSLHSSTSLFAAAGSPGVTLFDHVSEGLVLKGHYCHPDVKAQIALAHPAAQKSAAGHGSTVQHIPPGLVPSTQPAFSHDGKYVFATDSTGFLSVLAI